MSTPQYGYSLTNSEHCLRSTVAAAVRGRGRTAALGAGQDVIDHYIDDPADATSLKTDFQTAYTTAVDLLDTGTIAFKLCDSEPLTHDGHDLPSADTPTDIVKLAYVTRLDDTGAETIDCFPILETNRDAHHLCTCRSQTEGLWCAHSIAETILRNQPESVDEYYIDS